MLSQLNIFRHDLNLHTLGAITMQITDLQLPYMHEYLEVLKELSPTNITRSEYQDAYNYIMNQHKRVILAIDDNMVIGTASLLIEYKLIHGFSKVGHIEDVVVKRGYRNVGVGSKLIKHLTNIATDAQCYKIILNCDTKNIEFYGKQGFKQKEVTMRKNISQP